MVWTVSLLAILLLIVWILLIPIWIVIDTISEKYYIKLQGIAKASFESHDERVLRIHLRLFFFNRYFYPLEYKSTKTKKRTAKPGLRKIGNSFKKSLGLLKSFKLKKLYLNIDTGDYCLNAKMYSILFFLNQNKAEYNINFQGKNQLVLHIQNRPIHLLKSFINF